MNDGLIARVDRADDALAALAASAAVVVPGHLPVSVCERWVEGVLRARDAWTPAFGGEQFSLGRAFYTHLEEGASRAYFAGASASDAEVEAYAPDLQRAMRDLAAELVGVRVSPRRGWCGPGVHVFPPGGHVARRGGDRHFDTEGLAADHIARQLAAITIVVVLQAAEAGGGLRVWDVRYSGHDHPTDDELASASAIIPYGVGDVVLLDSYRLHQIQPFDGGRARISATVHAAEIDRGHGWECWF